MSGHMHLDPVWPIVLIFQPCSKYVNGQGEGFCLFRVCDAWRSFELESARPLAGIGVPAVGWVAIVTANCLTGSG